MSDQTSAPSVVTTEVQGPVLVIRLDDGKANAITHGLISGVTEALATAEADDAIGAVAIIGRPGRFSAGFDLKVMQAGPAEARDLLRAGFDLSLRIYTFPKPVVIGCTGHALAMAAILLMSADARIGSEGDFKLGMNEVRIGMPVPRYAVELARDRLAKDHFVPAIAHARIYDPAGAIEAGFLDEVVADGEAEAAAIAHATQLAEELRRPAFVLTRTNARGYVAEELQSYIDADMEQFVVG